MEAIEYLEPVFDSRKSYYKKAVIIRTDKGVIALQSYGTIVARIYDAMITEDGKPYFEIYGYYSQTTARHINDFLRQFNLISHNLSKKEMEELAYEK